MTRNLPLGLGQLAYDKRIRILAATQAADLAWENKDLGQGLLSYALVHDGLEKGETDWRPKDKKITLTEWLGYAVNDVPRLYEGKLGAGRGTELPTRTERPELQQPTLQPLLQPGVVQP